MDTTPLLDPEVIRGAVALIEEPGRWGQQEMDTGERVCAHGAVLRQHCTPGDEHLWRLVMRTKGLDEEWNDTPGFTPGDVAARMSRLIGDVTEDDMREALGPNWEEVRAFIRQVAALPPFEIRRLKGADAIDGIDELRRLVWIDLKDGWGVGSAASDAAANNGRPSTEITLTERRNFRCLARACGEALAARKELGEWQYDTLTFPFRAIGIVVHPDDPELRPV